MHPSAVKKYPCTRFTPLSSLHQGQNAYATMKHQAEQETSREENFGESLESDKIGRRKVRVGVEKSRGSFNDRSWKHKPLLLQEQGAHVETSFNKEETGAAPVTP